LAWPFVDDGDDCDQLNGARVLTADLESCWSYFQEESEYTFIASMYCDGGKWLLSIATVEGPYADFEAVVAGTCPPETGWVLTSSYCLGGSAKVCCGVEPSEDCDDCEANCDGAASITLVVSGFTSSSGCTNANGTYTLTRQSACYWSGYNENSNLGYVYCTEYGWQLAVMISIYPQNSLEIALVCSGDHPTGSGTFVFSGYSCATYGSWTLS
jgi:hypothetical protein